MDSKLVLAGSSDSLMLLRFEYRKSSQQPASKNANKDLAGYRTGAIKRRLNAQLILNGTVRTTQIRFEHSCLVPAVCRQAPICCSLQTLKVLSTCGVKLNPESEGFTAWDHLCCRFGEGHAKYSGTR